MMLHTPRRRAALVALASLIVFGSSGCATSSGDGAYLRGTKAFQARDWAAAERALFEYLGSPACATKREQRCRDAYSLIGEAMLADGQPLQAYRAFDIAAMVGFRAEDQTAERERSGKERARAAWQRVLAGYHGQCFLALQYRNAMAVPLRLTDVSASVDLGLSAIRTVPSTVAGVAGEGEILQMWAAAGPHNIQVVAKFAPTPGDARSPPWRATWRAIAASAGALPACKDGTRTDLVVEFAPDKEGLPSGVWHEDIRPVGPSDALAPPPSKSTE